MNSGKTGPDESASCGASLCRRRLVVALFFQLFVPLQKLNISRQEAAAATAAEDILKSV